MVKEWNPKLIYASNSGFGPDGEWGPRPSYDGMAQAFSGVLSNNAGGPSHAPRPIGFKHDSAQAERGSIARKTLCLQ